MGLLLNVDYNDYVVRSRAKKVLQIAGIKSVGEEEAVDAYYIHYRTPIFGGRAFNAVWRKFVTMYINSQYYSAVAPLCRLNHRASLEAAVRLLKAFEKYLQTLEQYGRAWFGLGRRDAWTEAWRQLRRHFGDPSDVEELYRVLKKLGEVLGRGRRGDPASLTLSLAVDPRRAKMAKILEKAVALEKLIGDPLGVGDAIVSTAGVIYGRIYSSIEKARRATTYTKALFLGAPLLFLHKATAAELSIRMPRAQGDRGVYLLVDKSGSMYSLIDGVEKIAVATAYALAVLRRYRRVVLRFFDAEVYDPVEDVAKMAEILLRVSAGGGTDISKAVEVAIDDVERRRLKNYMLVVVTDGEDDRINPLVLNRAKKVFKDVVFVLVGRQRPPPNVKSIRLPLGKDRPWIYSIEGTARAV